MLDGNTSSADPIKKFLTWYSENQTGKRKTVSQNPVTATFFGLLRRMLFAIFPWSNTYTYTNTILPSRQWTIRSTIIDS